MSLTNRYTTCVVLMVIGFAALSQKSQLAKIKHSLTKVTQYRSIPSNFGGEGDEVTDFFKYNKKDKYYDVDTQYDQSTCTLVLQSKIKSNAGNIIHQIVEVNLANFDGYNYRTVPAGSSFIFSNVDVTWTRSSDGTKVFDAKSKGLMIDGLSDKAVGVGSQLIINDLGNALIELATDYCN